MNVHTHTEVDALDTLLSDLGLGDESDEIIERAEEEICETTLEAAVASAEAQDVINAHYDSDSEEVTAAPVVADPLESPDSLLSETTEPVVETKAEKPKKEKKAKAPKEPKPPKAPKAPAVRKHYASKTERVTDKLGESLGDYMVLEISDAALVGDDLKAKQQETLDTLKDASVKVQNRMTFLIEFAAGKSAKLNDIATKALQLLKKDGKITTGESGNLHLALVEKYQKHSALAMGGNTINAMKSLKMIVQGEKGEYVANPGSLYLATINPMIGL